MTVDGEVKLLTENQSVYIPLGAVHRMENPGKVPMVLIEALGLPLPQLLGQAYRLSDLDWAALSERMVIKPVNAANSEGGIVAADGCDQMTGVVFGADLKSYASLLYEERFAKPPPVLVEELLSDVGAAEDPTLIVPRDYKVFTVAGHAAYVRVHDCNAQDGRRSIASFARDGSRLPPSLKGWPEAADETALPGGFDQLIAMAEYLSQKSPWLLRLDFDLTPQGPVLENSPPIQTPTWT